MFGRGNKDSYLTYKKVNIGLSNISSLVFRDPEHADIINFSKDGYYYAYLCDDKAVIDKKFELIKSYKLWLRVYDDDELILHCFADEIKVYKDNLEKLNSNERYKYKSTLDFVALYLLKVNREDKKFSKIISPYVEELKNIRDNQEIFISYNKKATKYNILYSMSFTRFVLLFKKDKGTNYSIY